MVGFADLAVHHPRGLLYFFLQFTQFFRKGGEFLLENLLVGLVVDGHFGLKCA